MSGFLLGALVGAAVCGGRTVEHHVTKVVETKHPMSYPPNWSKMDLFEQEQFCKDRGYYNEARAIEEQIKRNTEEYEWKRELQRRRENPTPEEQVDDLFIKARNDILDSVRNCNSRAETKKIFDTFIKESFKLLVGRMAPRYRDEKYTFYVDEINKAIDNIYGVPFSFKPKFVLRFKDSVERKLE